MKNRPLAVVSVAIIFCMIFTLSASALVKLEAPKANIVLDGVRDEGYSDFFDVAVFDEGSGTGAVGKASIAWDEDNFYYYIETTDTTPNHEDDNDYARDCIELFFDWDNYRLDGSSSNDDHPYWQIRVMSAPNAAGQQAANGINASGTTDGTGGWGVQEYIDATKFVVKPVSGNDLTNGYIIEVAMGVKQFGIEMKEGKVIGFEAAVGDNQEGAGRTSIAFIENADNSQWNNPAGLSADVTLTAAKVVENVDAPAQLEVAENPAPASERPTTAPPTGDTSILLIVLALIASLSLTTFVLRRNRGKA